MKSSILATTALLATICLATPALSASRQEKTQDFAKELQIPSSSPNSKPCQVTNTVQVAFPAWPGWFPWQF